MNDTYINGEKGRHKRIVFDFALSLLPIGIGREISRIAGQRRDCPEAISEIRLRARSSSSVIISGENISLSSSVGEKELLAVLDRLTDGSPLAHDREIREGYITSLYGIRAGIALSRIGNEVNRIYSIILRLPLGECSFAEELYGIWRAHNSGMLIYSAPGGGKTTALRGLAALIAKRDRKRIVIADERGEFDPEEFSSVAVDILRGYEKAKAVEIALRTLGAEVIVTDEIGNPDEAERLLSAGRGGIPILASAHAGDISELMKRAAILPLIEGGFFSSFIRLKREGGSFSYKSEDIPLTAHSS